MASIYRRKDPKRTIWGKWKDAAGVVQRAPLDTADENDARALVAEIERQAKAKASSPAAARGGLTVKDFVGTEEEPGEWLKMRKVSKPFACADDYSRLVHHLFPVFGDPPGARVARRGARRGRGAGGTPRLRAENGTSPTRKRSSATTPSSCSGSNATGCR